MAHAKRSAIEMDKYNTKKEFLNSCLCERTGRIKGSS